MCAFQLGCKVREEGLGEGVPGVDEVEHGETPCGAVSLEVPEPVGVRSVGVCGDQVEWDHLPCESSA